MRRRIHASQAALEQLPTAVQRAIRLKKCLNKHTTRNKRPYPPPLSSPSSSKSPLEKEEEGGGFSVGPRVPIGSEESEDPMVPIESEESQDPRVPIESEDPRVP